MPGHKCSYFRCKNTLKMKTMFHFPCNDVNRLNIWLANCGNMKIAHLPPQFLRSRYICIDHFKKQYILNEIGARKRLLKTAIPEPYQEPEELHHSATSSAGMVDPNCSSCSKAITGFVFVCVQCATRACSACDAQGHHARHYVLRAPACSPEEELQQIVVKVREAISSPARAQPESGEQTDDMDDNSCSDNVIKTEIKLELDVEENDPLASEYEELSSVPETSGSQVVPEPTKVKEEQPDTPPPRHPSTRKSFANERNPSTRKGFAAQLPSPDASDSEDHEPPAKRIHFSSDSSSDTDTTHAPRTKTLKTHQRKLASGNVEIYGSGSSTRSSLQAVRRVVKPRLNMNRTWQPGNALPREFEEDFIDEEEDEADVDNNVPEDVHEKINKYPDLPVFAQTLGGELVPLIPHDLEEADPPLSVGIPPEANQSPSADSSAPVQSPEPERIRAEALPPPLARRRAVAVRGRARGRGRGRARARRRGAGDRRWMRGEPLEETYIDDADLPENIKEDIRKILTARTRRNVEEGVIDDDIRVDESLIGTNEGFVWRPMSEWNGVKENFVPEKTGPTRPVGNAYDALKYFWTDDIMSHIVNETNRYALSLSESRPRFKKNWYKTNADEMWVLFAFWMMLGIIKMPSVKSCFTNLPILQTDIFRRLFLETRYWDVNAAFHLAEGTDRNNPLHPMGPIIEHLNNKFKEMYRLDQDICIDESLTLWKGPVGFKQYIKTKAARFGIKSYQLCESATGYLWAVFIYIGRGPEPSPMLSSVQAVQRLVQPLLHLGHTPYMDNWFNSPLLARWLKRHRTDCVGTLRATRKHVPLDVQRCSLEEGQFIARASEDVMVLSVQDRKRVTCLSTYHDVSQVRKDARPGQDSGQFKLKLIDDYNKNMGGVDRLDQMLEPYLLERKQCLKWSKKIFKHFLNISIQNARILVEKSTNTKIDSLAFRLVIVDEIVKRHLPNIPARPQRQFQARPKRLTERHFIHRTEITEKMQQTIKHRCNLGRRNCVWCTRNGKRNTKTVYECAECQAPLCLDPCFKEYHTIE